LLDGAVANVPLLEDPHKDGGMTVHVGLDIVVTPLLQLKSADPVYPERELATVFPD
jgi:hypothetical protein